MSPVIARHGFRPKATGADGMPGTLRTKATRRPAIWDWKLWRKSCAVTFWSINLAITDALGARAMIHSDSALGVQRLNQEVAKAMYAGRAAGINITEDQAIKWLTINPAWALALDDKIGSIEVGKNADVVLWSGNPFSVYTKAEKVWIDGALLFDRADATEKWRTDFELGNVKEGN